MQELCYYVCDTRNKKGKRNKGNGAVVHVPKAAENKGVWG
jgi:hypothetical protein